MEPNLTHAAAGHVGLLKDIVARWTVENMSSPQFLVNFDVYAEDSLGFLICTPWTCSVTKTRRAGESAMAP
jgi:hypothetical protein